MCHSGCRHQHRKRYDEKTQHLRTLPPLHGNLCHWFWEEPRHSLAIRPESLHYPSRSAMLYTTGTLASRTTSRKRVISRRQAVAKLAEARIAAESWLAVAEDIPDRPKIPIRLVRMTSGKPDSGKIGSAGNSAARTPESPCVSRRLPRQFRPPCDPPRRLFIGLRNTQQHGFPIIPPDQLQPQRQAGSAKAAG